MNCPHCGHKQSDAAIRKEAARLNGRRGTGAAKARTSEQARAAAREMWRQRRERESKGT